jgi:hypothetical protein
MNAGATYVSLVLLGVASFFAIVALRAFVRYRGVRIVTCPETQAPAAVRVDAGHAAVSAARDRTELRLDQCSRWPERAECGQACTRELSTTPHDCLVRSILTRWYEGKRCVYCDKLLALTNYAQLPALRAADGHTFDFASVPPEQLVAHLDEYAPVCFDCHLMEQFRAEHPEMVVERPEFERRA